MAAGLSDTLSGPLVVPLGGTARTSYATILAKLWGAPGWSYTPSSLVGGEGGFQEVFVVVKRPALLTLRVPVAPTATGFASTGGGRAEILINRKFLCCAGGGGGVATGGGNGGACLGITGQTSVQAGAGTGSTRSGPGSSGASSLSAENGLPWPAPLTSPVSDIGPGGDGYYQGGNSSSGSNAGGGGGCNGICSTFPPGVKRLQELVNNGRASTPSGFTDPDYVSGVGASNGPGRIVLWIDGVKYDFAGNAAEQNLLIK